MKNEKYTGLELAIITANIAYREGEPIMSDEEYDIQLLKLKSETPDSELLKTGVIEKILTSSEGRKQKLPIPMYSLNKVKSIDEFIKWIRSKGAKEGDKLVITPKFDGISLVVVEEEKKCWTRGDGEVGQRSDLHYSEIPQPENQFDVITFGEAIMPKKNFEKHTENFANARNMVAGMFNKKDPSENINDIHYMRYGSNMDSIDKSDQLFELNTMNSHAVPCVCYPHEYLFESFHEDFNYLYSIWSEEYNIDGLVIEFDSAIKRQELGREENMNPAYAVAIKFPEWGSNGITRVKGITWKISKQGKLKPVINIEPIELAGVTISNVTGYNAKYIFDNNVAEGSVIEITRSGDVIPKHLKTNEFSIVNVEVLADNLTQCPCCGQPTKWDETFTELICINDNCKEKRIAKLVHFFKTLKIEDFGEPSIIQLFENGFETIQDILIITKDELCKIDGWGDKSANIILKQFEALKTQEMPLAKLLHAMDSFSGKLGEKECQTIYDNISELTQHDLEQRGLDITLDLTKINGIGEVTAKYFQLGIKTFYSTLLSDLHFYNVYTKTPQKEQSSNKYEGFNVCMSGFRDKELQNDIESNGGKLVSGVSKNTTHLLVKDKSSTSSKMKKAEGLGIETLTKEEFLNLQL